MDTPALARVPFGGALTAVETFLEHAQQLKVLHRELAAREARDDKYLRSLRNQIVDHVKQCERWAQHDPLLTALWDKARAELGGPL